MSSALDEFRAHREAVEDVQRRLADVANLVRSLQEQATALSQDEGLRELLRSEETWLRRAEDVIRAGRDARECELQRFWPGVWRRWAVAMVLALVVAFAAGAGYVWAVRPYQSELAALRTTAGVGDEVVRKLQRMTPTQRQQFEDLMRRSSAGAK